MNWQAIFVDNLTVQYRHRPALKDINFPFEAGAMYAICGPNGAGKSTLLKAMMGLLHPHAGEVSWQGLSRCHLAYLPQQADIDRHQPMSVFELVAMGLWYEIGFFGRVNHEQAQRVEHALRRVGMADFAQRSIAELSNGQFQRVLFARLLVQNALFLLLDEPFNAIDAKTTHQLLDILREENQAGRAIIAVLHDYEQVRAYFPYTLLISREIVASGDSHEILCAENLQKANHLAYAHDDEAWNKPAIAPQSTP